MRTSKILCVVFLFVFLFVSYPYLNVQARQTPTPENNKIELLGVPDGDLNLTTDQLSNEGYTFYLHNKTQKDVQVEIRLLGLNEIIRVDAGVKTLKPDEVVQVKLILSSVNNSIDRKHNGIITLNPPEGDFIYQHLSVSSQLS
ncbi:MAG: hypothetical protein LWX83_10530, partial [Anaerolineae bacterium]|nr:hypothetical protein [Anaerolineae bacterium]